MIKIYTFQFNNAEFLELQHKTFKRFLKQEHEIICINNSFDKDWERNAIRDKAAELGIAHYIPGDVDHHSGAGRSHQDALNWTWRKFVVDSNDITIFIDHDMFPIRDVPIDLNYDIVGVMQGRGEHIKYLHPGIIIANNTLKDKETINFIGEKIDGHDCDSGGNLHYYLQSHPDLKIKGLSLVNICPEHENMDVLPSEAREGYFDGDCLQLLENYMIHYRAGSNWCHTPHDIFMRKMEQLKQTLNYYMSL